MIKYMVKLVSRKKNVSASSQASNEDLPQDTRDKLIQVAKTLFAQKGFDGTTVKDIADAAGMNISLISYHFHGKEGLYRTCLEQIGKARLATNERILQKPNSLEEFRVRLQMFIEDILKVHLEEPELSKIINRECDMETPIALDIFKETFFKSFETLMSFFKGAQDKGIIRKDMQPEIIAGLIFGGIIHIAHKDRLSETFLGRTIKDPKHRESLIQQATAFCLHGCATPQPFSDRSPS